MCIILHLSHCFIQSTTRVQSLGYDSTEGFGESVMLCIVYCSVFFVGTSLNNTEPAHTIAMHTHPHISNNYTVLKDIVLDYYHQPQGELYLFDVTEHFLHLNANASTVFDGHNDVPSTKNLETVVIQENQAAVDADTLLSICLVIIMW